MKDNTILTTIDLINLLKLEGCNDEAIELDNIYQSSFTGNELIMGTRHILKKLKLEKISEISKIKIQAHLKYLNQLLP